MNPCIIIQYEIKIQLDATVCSLIYFTAKSDCILLHLVGFLFNIGSAHIPVQNVRLTVTHTHTHTHTHSHSSRVTLQARTAVHYISSHIVYENVHSG